MLGFFESINTSLFLMLNGTAEAPAWLSHLAIFLAEDTAYLLPLLLLWLWLWGGHSQRGTVLKALLVVIVGLIFSKLTGLALPHPRPFMIGLGRQWIEHAPSSSFPSNHMTIFTAIGLTLFLDGLKRWGFAVLLLALAVAWARVFVGVHYPFDMIGAVIFVLIADAVVAPLWLRFGNDLIAVCERIYRLVLAKPIAVGWIRK